MRVLVLDTRNGDPVSDLFIVNPYRRTVDGMHLNNVPELHFDASANELLVVETELAGGKNLHGATYWLKMYDGDTLSLKHKVETPARCMYTGFPNRSTRVKAAQSGRFIFVQEIGKHPERFDVIRTRVRRYDRAREVFEAGAPFVDSCLVDFGNFGTSDEDLYFHLCCEEPSTVAFANFSSPEVTFARMTGLDARNFSAQETCGSWLDADDQSLYCTNREGWIYRARQPPAPTSLWAKLPIKLPRAVPLQHIYGSGGRLYVGVARDICERSLSLASEIWEISLADAEILRVIALPSPVLNFVVAADPAVIVGVNPYDRALQFIDLKSAQLVDQIEDFGTSPAEVQLIP